MLHIIQETIQPARDCPMKGAAERSCLNVHPFVHRSCSTKRFTKRPAPDINLRQSSYMPCPFSMHRMPAAILNPIDRIAYAFDCYTIRKEGRFAFARFISISLVLLLILLDLMYPLIGIAPFVHVEHHIAIIHLFELIAQSLYAYTAIMMNEAIMRNDERIPLQSNPDIIIVILKVAELEPFIQKARFLPQLSPKQQAEPRQPIYAATSSGLLCYSF